MENTNKTNPLTVIPLYKQVMNILENEISDGIWKYGEKIPNENELSERFSVSRITIRAALEELVDEGLLVRIQGKGTFVSKNLKKTMFSIGSQSFSDLCKQNGYIPNRIQLKKEIIDASESDIVKLNLKNNDKIVHLFRILCVGNTPIILTHDFIRPGFEFLVEKDLENNSLTELMLNSGQINSIKSTHRTIEVCTATANEAECLNLNLGSPLILLKDISADEHGIPLRWTKELIAADKVRIEYKD